MRKLRFVRSGGGLALRGVPPSFTVPAAAAASVAAMARGCPRICGRARLRGREAWPTYGNWFLVHGMEKLNCTALGFLELCMEQFSLSMPCDMTQTTVSWPCLLVAAAGGRADARALCTDMLVHNLGESITSWL